MSFGKLQSLHMHTLPNATQDAALAGFVYDRSSSLGSRCQTWLARRISRPSRSPRPSFVSSYCPSSR